jgi:hypothetical protein
MRNLAQVTWTAYTIPHHGNHPDENEDAFSPEIRHQVFTAQAHLTCAVADGATQTSFSRAWARLLVQKAVDLLTADDLSELLSAAQADWHAMINGINLPWHAEEKVRQGAFSSLLWLGILPSGRAGKSGGSWKSAAVGDTCVFQFRNNELVTMFPRLESFHNSPVLLSSQAQRNSRILDSVTDYLMEGTWNPGDEFIIMTDAAAAWLSCQLENQTIEELRSTWHQFMQTQESFEGWVEGQRLDGKIKDDDTTIVWIRL